MNVAPGPDSAFQMTIGVKGVFAVFAMVLPLSVLFSATMLAIALFAKSFREAQSYLSPLTFVVIMPAVASFLPGIELNARTALIPILSTSLVSKEIVGGTYHWSYIALIFASSCVYASVAIAAAVHLFNREDVLFRV
jgi:sodium transport system permease protein